MKKIIFVTNCFMTGGVETVFINLSKSIKEEIYLLPVHAEYSEHMINQLPDNVKRIEMNMVIKRTPVGIIKAVLGALRIKRECKSDELVAINFSDTLTTLLVSYFLNPKKCISWIHCNPSALLKSKTSAVYFHMLKKCRKLVFICDAQKRYFLNMKESKGFNVDYMETCTNFFNIDRIRKLADEPVQSSKRYFLMVARLDKRSKDFDTLVKAYSKLPENIKDEYDLVIMGYGPDKQYIQNLTEICEVVPNVKLMDAQANPYKYMRNSSLFILSSKSEGYANVLVEALACGCNIISSNCNCGPSEILGKGKYGRLFEVSNWEDLVDQITDALNNPIPAKVAIDRSFEITMKGKVEFNTFWKNLW